MRDRPTVVLVTVVVALCAATALLVARHDEPAAPPTAGTTRPTLKDGGLIGRYDVTVTDSSGQSQQASFTCGTVNKATGYLAKSLGYESCRTAITPGPAREYLETGKRPPADCAAIRDITHAGWRYVITGESLNPQNKYVPVHQELTVKTACDEVLWQQMKELLSDPLKQS